MAVLAGLALLAALAGLVVVGLRYRAEQREGARVRALFSRYLAPPIVDELLRRKDPRLYTGRSVQATILVCRIWNFAGFSETLDAPETLRYLNEFFALSGSSIHKYGGLIDKFLGDGIIGVFGVPLEDPSAAEHALRAALDIVRLVHAMDQRWRAQGRRSFQVGIGITSGEVIAGDAGFDERREFTVTGPQALLAERLQTATVDLNAAIIAAAATCDAVSDRFTLVPLAGHPLPGLKRLADAYIVIGLTTESPKLTLPAAAVFRETMVEPPANVVAIPVPAPPAVKLRPVRVSPPPPDAPAVPLVELADPLAPLRPRNRTGDSVDAAFGLPEWGVAQRHDDESDRPILPDPPSREGPSIRLPP